VARGFARGVHCPAGSLFALGKDDHDPAIRRPGLTPILSGLLIPWILMTARRGPAPPLCSHALARTRLKCLLPVETVRLRRERLGRAQRQRSGTSV